MARKRFVRKCRLIFLATIVVLESSQLVFVPLKQIRDFNNFILAFGLVFLSDIKKPSLLKRLMFHILKTRQNLFHKTLSKALVFINNNSWSIFSTPQTTIIDFISVVYVFVGCPQLGLFSHLNYSRAIDGHAFVGSDFQSIISFDEFRHFKTYINFKSLSFLNEVGRKTDILRCFIPRLKAYFRRKHNGV